MTRALVVLTAILLLKASPPALIEQIEKKQSPGSESKLKAGDLVRINYVTTGIPGRLAIFPTLEQAKRNVQEANAKLKEGRVHSTESRLFIGHNTPATIDQLDSFSLGGKEFHWAQVTFGAGPLRGQKFWVNFARLRGANEPDPALKTLNEANKLTGSPRQIDPDYRPKTGDEVILGMVEKLMGPESENQNGNDSEGDKAQLCEIVLIFPKEPPTSDPDDEFGAGLREMPTKGGYAVTASGTRATIESPGDFFDKLRFDKVRIDSGAFKGQVWFVLGVAVSRPEAFAKAKRRPESVVTSVKRQTTKRPARKERDVPLPPDCKIVLTDATSNPTLAGSLIQVSGRIRNTSDAPLKRIKVKVSFEDRDGKLVRSASGSCEPSTIEPGESASFETLVVENDDRIVGFKLSFMDRESAIPWVDKSGKDVHE
jgi:hypothetical protein